MHQNRNFNIQEENELQKTLEHILRHYYLFVWGIVLALGIAFIINRYVPPVYKVTSTILIKESEQNMNVGEFINNNIFGDNKNLQNELLMIQSFPVISQTIKNLDLPISYYRKKGFYYIDEYKNVPFKVLYQNNHNQPVGVRFKIKFLKDSTFFLSASSKNAVLYNFEKSRVSGKKKGWNFEVMGKIGKLIETPELSFIIEYDNSLKYLLEDEQVYYFVLLDVPTLSAVLVDQMKFEILGYKATAIEISLKSTSLEKGLDIVNGITDVYSKQNLEKKNYLAGITLDYIDKQLGAITDSLNNTEQTLQRFRSSKQLLNVTEQSSGITSQLRELENQRAELVTKIRYYQYVSDYLEKHEDYTNIIVPSSLGIQDQLLNNLMGELMTAQTQKSNFIENNQEKNPLVKKLNIQIENTKKAITQNISYVLKTSEISMDELNKRIGKIEAQISRMPQTERELTGIERKYRLNDAIYNYLMEKRAEANITKASNLPDNEVVEPAKMVGTGPISPNKKMNYAIAIFLGLVIPFGYIQLKSIFNNKIDSQEQIEKFTDTPVLGKILHNTKANSNAVFDNYNSPIAEAFRTLRTNLEYYVRGGHKKVILVTSSIEGEGKSFNAMNIAISYAQLNRKTILINFDLRKNNTFFSEKGENIVGLSSYLINMASLEDIIINSPYKNLDFISSGPIPPNPVELISLDKTEKLLQKLKETYDYIIIDTPPLAQVTDAYLLIEHADVKVMIARYNYTLKNVFSFIIKDLKQKNISNVCIVLNDNRYYRDQYGYGYGYNKKGSKKSNKPK